MRLHIYFKLVTGNPFHLYKIGESQLTELQVQPSRILVLADYIWEKFEFVCLIIFLPMRTHTFSRSVWRRFISIICVYCFCSASCPAFSSSPSGCTLMSGSSSPSCTRSANNLVPGSLYSSLVSFPDLIQLVYQFQYNTKSDPHWGWLGSGTQT